MLFVRCIFLIPVPGCTSRFVDIRKKHVFSIVLFEELKKHDNEEIREWAEKSYSDIRENILGNREDEDRRNFRGNERFE